MRAVIGRARTLNDCAVSPGSGTTATTFTFSVVYKDSQNRPNPHVWVRIDGTNHDMSPSGPVDLVAGTKFVVSVSGLSAGAHQFRFATQVNGSSIVRSEWGGSQRLEPAARPHPPDAEADAQAHAQAHAQTDPQAHARGRRPAGDAQAEAQAEAHAQTDAEAKAQGEADTQATPKAATASPAPSPAPTASPTPLTAAVIPGTGSPKTGSTTRGPNGAGPAGDLGGGDSGSTLAILGTLVVAMGSLGMLLVATRRRRRDPEPAMAEAFADASGPSITAHAPLTAAAPIWPRRRTAAAQPGRRPWRRPDDASPKRRPCRAGGARR